MSDLLKKTPEYLSWPGCRDCRNYVDGGCKAWPLGIPAPILAGLVDHMRVQPGQTGDTVFEPSVNSSEPTRRDFE